MQVFYKRLLALSLLVFIFDSNLVLAESRVENIARTCDKIIHQLAGDDTKAYFGFTPQIDIIDSNYPNAFAVGGRSVIITTGLIKKLQNEDELAFVLAHELAHLYLNHGKSSFNNLASDSLQHELEADQHAYKMLAKSNYGNAVAIKLFNRLSHDSLSVSLKIRSNNLNKLALAK